MERDEFAVATRAEVPPGHIDVVDDEALAVLVDVTVVGHRDGQRALLGVVDARKARSIVCNIKSVIYCEQKIAIDFYLT